MKIAIVGGGASGFFSAINIKYKFPEYDVFVFEKSKSPLSKLKISGGGRCNVTNGLPEKSKFVKSYPRGEKYFKKIFNVFNNSDIITWFRNRGIELKTEEDNRVFPVSNSSQTIIDCFLKECDMLGVKIGYNLQCEMIFPLESGFNLKILSKGEMYFDKVVVCVGGGNKIGHYDLLKHTGHEIIAPLPSLFTFNLKDKSICSLMGLVVADCMVSVKGYPYESSGAVLITHWGLSGPAIIKLSAYSAEYLHEKNYSYSVKVNWVQIKNQQSVLDHIHKYKENNHLKNVYKHPLFELPVRIWVYLCEKAEIKEMTKWSELSNKSINKLIEWLTNSEFEGLGKTTFKDEFVTCGGVKLDNVDMDRMESKLTKGLFFAGEVVNIDGITGGYNFQNAWSTAFVVAQNIGIDR